MELCLSRYHRFVVFYLKIDSSTAMCLHTRQGTASPGKTSRQICTAVPASWSDFMKRLSFFGLVAASTSGTDKQQPSLQDY